MKLVQLVECVGEGAARNPCKVCGSTWFLLKPGKGPHALGMCCNKCGGNSRWIPKCDRDEVLGNALCLIVEETNEIH